MFMDIHTYTSDKLQGLLSSKKSVLHNKTIACEVRMDCGSIWRAIFIVDPPPTQDAAVLGLLEHLALVLDAFGRVPQCTDWPVADFRRQWLPYVAAHPLPRVGQAQCTLIKMVTATAHLLPTFSRKPENLSGSTWETVGVPRAGCPVA